MQMAWFGVHLPRNEYNSPENSLAVIQTSLGVTQEPQGLEFFSSSSALAPVKITPRHSTSASSANKAPMHASNSMLVQDIACAAHHLHGSKEQHQKEDWDRRLKVRAFIQLSFHSMMMMIV